MDRLLVELRADERVQVSWWPAGEQYPRQLGDPVELVWPLDDDDLADLRWYLERYLYLPTAVYGERGARVAARLPEWGAGIFGAVFGPGPARDAYVTARARGGPVEIAFLSRSAEQLGRPWELMADPEAAVPVVLERGVSVSRSLQSGGTRGVFDVPGSRLRVLMVISRPDGASDVGYQMIARPLLRRLEAVRGSVDLVVLRPPTLEALRATLDRAREAGEPFQVVHFDGHGAFGRVPVSSGAAHGGGWSPVMYDAAGPQGMLAFEQPGGGSHLVPAADVARVLTGAEVPVVVLNACQSAQVGTQVEAAVATRLLAEGCASVVAMAYSVYAVAAAEFMTAFYERLFAGDRVAEAVAAGRQQLRANRERPSMKGKLPLEDWMVPVLYTRRDVRFPGLRTERGAAEALDDILTRMRAAPPADAQEGQAASPEQELAPFGEFVGRDGLLYTLDVAARLQSVVVLHGPGGSGKTELAKAFGRWWRDTGGVDDPGWVLWHSFEPGVASFGLDGVVNSIGRRLFDDRFALLTAAQRRAVVQEVLTTRRLLLLWDNFESVHAMPDPGRATPPLDQDGQDALRTFLARIASGGRSAVVITSRTKETWLGADFRRIEVGGLTTSEATEYADHLLAPCPAARGRRGGAAFADLMRRLDGHPLSMRLVLPHLDTTGPEDLLAALRGATPLPGVEGTDRSTSLAASIAYSFDHLGPQDQRALTVLSLFHGVADADVLGTFSGLPDVPDRFRGLGSQQWTRVLERATELGLLTGLGANMFGIHPALPSYAAARWRTDAPGTHAAEAAAATRALLTAHAVFGRWLLGQFTGGDARLALALITRQQRMLGIMLGHALDTAQWEHAQGIAQPLNEHWNVRGLDEEAKQWVDRIRMSVEAPDGTPPELDTLAGALWLFASGAQAGREARAGLLDQADRSYHAMLRMLRGQPETPRQRGHIATTCHMLGYVAQEHGRLDDAENWYRRSLTISEELGNRPNMAGTYHQLGNIAERQGQLDQAEDWYRRSLAISEELGNRPNTAITYHQLGMIAEGRGRLDDAEDWYRRSLTIDGELGNRPGMATTYHQLGGIAYERGRLDDAEEWYRGSLTIEEELGNRPNMAGTYHQLGNIAYDRGRLDDAENWYRRSLALREELGNRHSMAGAFHQLGNVAHSRGRPDDAEDWYRRSLAISEELGNRPGMATTYHQLGIVAHGRGRLGDAEARYRQALTLYEELGDLPNMATACGRLGVLAEDRGQPTTALQWVVSCVALFEEFPHPAAGPGPEYLKQLTSELGLPALETAWRTVTGNPLPPAVRAYVLAPQADTD